MNLSTLKTVWPQPFIGIALTISALGGLALTWSSERAVVDWQHLLLGLCLVAAIAAAYHFPIHAGDHLKVELTTVPLYLLAVLMPSAHLAALMAGTGILIGELLVRKARGNYLSDVATASARWVLVVLFGGYVAHLPIEESLMHLAAPALVLWIGDTLTLPFVLSPMRNESPLTTLITSAREGALSEVAQYVVGVLAALVAQVHVGGLVLVMLPIWLIYLTSKNLLEMQHNTRYMLESMADTVDLRDPYTGGHSRRVAEHCARILRELQIDGPDFDLIVSAARVHDIGKIGVPDYILNKPSRLTPEEEAMMQTHPDRGADLLQRYRDFARGVAIVRHHHESWDGTGYPAGLKGKQIPFGSRVIAVADSFDAMTSDRPYRTAMPVDKAVAILRAGSNQQWDATIVDAFLRSIGKRDEQTALSETRAGQSLLEDYAVPSSAPA